MDIGKWMMDDGRRNVTQGVDCHHLLFGVYEPELLFLSTIPPESPKYPFFVGHFLVRFS